MKWRECSEMHFAEVWALYELVFGGKRPFKVSDHGPKACSNVKKAVFFPDHFSVWVFFSLSLSREVLGLGMSLSGTPWGRPKKTLVIIIIVVAPYK